MFHVLYVVEKFKYERQRKKEIFIFVKIIQNLVITYHGINQEYGETWTPNVNDKDLDKEKEEKKTAKEKSKIKAKKQTKKKKK